MGNKRFIAVMTTLVILIVLFVLFINKILPSENIDLLTNLPDKTYNWENLELGTNPGAPITIIEFGDFTCTHCAALAPDIKTLLSLYPGEINLVFKHYPNDETKDSPRAALASECARQQEKFIEYHDLLFERQLDFSYNKLIEYAAKLGVHPQKFVECMENFKTLPKVENDIKEARLNGVRGTPTLFINNRKIEGVQPLQTLRLLIDQEKIRVK
ncbi:MAG: thioredoxin domain-containing protein [Candidatus Woesearchaeota archaeon]|jgi:protein-disulfide isomerase|nr:thioredoxin domain-containing protein [Candidatus Woesearchaeota archaeon]MDP7457298.1 thioredoxin domain-containing protein [Candidatus Woesearchaeota archaeon]